MTRPYAIDPSWVPLAEGVLLTADAWRSDLLLMGAPRKGHTPATLVELRGVIVGAALGGSHDATLRLFRHQEGDGPIPGPDDLHFHTQTMDLGANAAPGTELVSNGTFTGNATGWDLGTGLDYNTNRVRLTLAGGSPRPASPASQLLGSPPSAGDIVLLLFTTQGLPSDGSGLVRAQVSPTAEFVGQNLLPVIPESTSLQNLAVLTPYPADGNDRIMFWAENRRTEPFGTDVARTALDNVSLTVQDPHRFSCVKRLDDIGHGFLAEIAPVAGEGATLADSYLWLYARRYAERD